MQPSRINVNRAALAAVVFLAHTLTASRHAAAGPESTPADCPAPVVIYLNFNGAQLHGDGTCEDARSNCSLIVGRYGRGRPVAFPKFSGDAASQDTIARQVRRFFAPYHVEIVLERPRSGIYEMVMIGGRAEDVGWTGDPRQGIAAGMAVRDCGNRNGANIAFAFAETQENDVQRVATVVAQEVGHAFGLGHVSHERDVMRGAVNGLAEGFLNAGLNVAPNETCGATTCQNNALLLKQTLGLACGAHAAVLPSAEADECTSPVEIAGLGENPSVATAREVVGCSFAENGRTPLLAALIVLATGLLMVLASLRKSDVYAARPQS